MVTEMAKAKRRQRSNIDGQEEMVSALWDFAREVERCVKAGATFTPTEYVKHPLNQKSIAIMGVCTDEQLMAICKTMERISTGYGYRIVEIQ